MIQKVHLPDLSAIMCISCCASCSALSPEHCFLSCALVIITNVTLLILILLLLAATDVFHPLFHFYLSEIIYLHSQKRAEVLSVLVLLAFVTAWILPLVNLIVPPKWAFQ